MRKQVLQFNCSIDVEHHDPTINQSGHLPLAHHPQSVAFCATGHPSHHIVRVGMTSSSTTRRIPSRLAMCNKSAMEGSSVARISLFILFKA